MKQNKKIYTVSRINALIKKVLERELPPRLTVTGEITDWKHHHSGHCYFSLKDEKAQLPCVMWRSNFSKVKFQPENGLAVLADGFIDVYPPQGRYQFYIDSLMPAGLGALQLAFEQMVQKLEQQGLFKDEHKKPLPPYPGRIGILTSESGAALHDIKDSIQNRWPCAKLLLYPVPVQGDSAAQKIADALRTINKNNNKYKLDLLILGRGGGSLEDLWAFNEEILAKEIFNSLIPVISAVGHERDTTVADLVADARASTPTKAGVVAVPDIRDILQQIANLKIRLRNNAQSRLDLAKQNLHTILASAAFRNPLLPVMHAQQQLDEIRQRLAASLKDSFARARELISSSYRQIVKIEPHRLLGDKRLRLNKLRNTMANSLGSIVNQRRIQLTARENRLAALNPKAVLNRGYTITTNKKTGKMITDLQDIELDDLLITELPEEKAFESKVTKK